MWRKKETVQPLTGYTVPYIEITSLWGVPKWDDRFIGTPEGTRTPNPRNRKAVKIGLWC